MSEKYIFAAEAGRWELTAPNREIALLAMADFLSSSAPFILLEGEGELIYAPDGIARNQLVGCDHKEFRQDHLQEYMDAVSSIRRIKIDENE